MTIHSPGFMDTSSIPDLSTVDTSSLPELARYAVAYASEARVEREQAAERARLANAYAARCAAAEQKWQEYERRLRAEINLRAEAAETNER